LHDEARLVCVLSRARDREQVDDGVRVAAHRREQHLAPAPLLHPLGREPELAAIERERALDVGDVEHDVVERDDPQFVVHHAVGTYHSGYFPSAASAGSSGGTPIAYRTASSGASTCDQKSQSVARVSPVSWSPRI